MGTLSAGGEDDVAWWGLWSGVPSRSMVGGLLDADLVAAERRDCGDWERQGGGGESCGGGVSESSRIVFRAFEWSNFLELGLPAPSSLSELASFPFWRA